MPDWLVIVLLLVGPLGLWLLMRFLKRGEESSRGNRHAAPPEA